MAIPFDDNQLAWHSLIGLLDTVETVIFVVRDDGQVRHASALGRVRQQADPAGLKRELRAAIAAGGHDRAWRCTPLGLEGWFVVEATANENTQRCLDRARARFRLTPRQREVLDLLIGGATNQTIATVLNITPRTVEVHLSAIYERAGVENRTSLVSLVLTAA